VSQGLVDYTTDVLFGDLWLRPDLAPRLAPPEPMALASMCGATVAECSPTRPT
jgi:hypothetical protein